MQRHRAIAPGLPFVRLLRWPAGADDRLISLSTIQPPRFPARAAELLSVKELGLPSTKEGVVRGKHGKTRKENASRQALPTDWERTGVNFKMFFPCLSVSSVDSYFFESGPSGLPYVMTNP
jgi:hypothetical protein